MLTHFHTFLPSHVTDFSSMAVLAFLQFLLGLDGVCIMSHSLAGFAPVHVCPQIEHCECVGVFCIADWCQQVG